MAVQVDAVFAEQRLEHGLVLMEEFTGLEADAQLRLTGRVLGEYVDVARFPRQPVCLDHVHRLGPVAVMLPQFADVFVAWACQQHHLRELVSLPEELRHPFDRGGIHYSSVRAAQDSMVGLAVERPADAGAQDFRWLGPEGRPAEGQVHSVEHLMTQQHLPRA
ncbi:MAG: hypothetical protein JOY82_10075 [Streptosporangiaceae bacterium]|nr:hypothetical protein [Streptosporangiaceae bacterium]